MASKKVLEEKQKVIDEIKSCVRDNNSLVFFDYRGITDGEAKELRRKLKESGSDYKVYKNTLMARALTDLNITLGNHLNGPSALAFSSDQIAPIKILADFAKKHTVLVLKVGIVDGEVAEKDKLDKLATIPSREGLLTMLAGALIGIPKDLAICLDLYAKQKEE